MAGDISLPWRFNNTASRVNQTLKMHARLCIYTLETGVTAASHQVTRLHSYI